MTHKKKVLHLPLYFRAFLPSFILASSTAAHSYDLRAANASDFRHYISESAVINTADERATCSYSADKGRLVLRSAENRRDVKEIHDAC